MAKARTVEQGWTPNTHGIASSYNRGCRCVECTQANTNRHRIGGYQQTLHTKRLAERELIDGHWVHPDPYRGHGTLAAYTGCGCRCQPCREAKREYQKAAREAKAVEGWRLDDQQEHPDRR